MPLPDPYPEPEPDPDEPPAARAATQPADVRIVLEGSVAALTGVVERAADRQRIVDAISTLESITAVEDGLRPRAV